MNEEHWQKIIDFDLDNPVSEYGFSTRLENENFWTVNFARNAIIEYKKFMYLASVYDFMVSPSAIVDIVWHQHLIFTQSYEEFCQVLGKKIDHIPSTHHSSDFNKFITAEEQTRKLYEENFGEQPAGFWQYSSMTDALQMRESRSTIDLIIAAGVLLVILATCVAYYFLRPLYITIDNPYFIFSYLSVCIVFVAGLEFYNRFRLGAIVAGWNKSSFIFNLTALELVYLKNNTITAVIHGIVNRLILEEKVRVSSDNKLTVDKSPEINNPAEYAVVNSIEHTRYITYQELLKKLELKPVFNKTARAIDAFTGEFNKSKQFINLFKCNFIVLSVLFLLAAVRLMTGIARDKPVTIIAIVVIACLIFIAMYLSRLKTLVGKLTIPEFYKKNIIADNVMQDDWDWQYFLLGAAVFSVSFAPLVNYTNPDGYFGNNGDGGSSGSSCSSGSGSSCGGGGSCGGCGGGGD